MNDSTCHSHEEQDFYKKQDRVKEVVAELGIYRLYRNHSGKKKVWIISVRPPLLAECRL